MMSISTIARSGVEFHQLDRLAAGRRGQHVHAAPLQHARKREDVARVVVDQQRGAPDQVLVGAGQPLQHALLLGRQIGHHAVQEQRGFVEQPLGRFHALDHDAARHGVQLGVLLRRQLAAGEHHHRNVRQAKRRRGSSPAPRSRSCRAAGGRAPRNRRACRAASSARRVPVPTVTISMSSWPSSSVMLICSAALSSTTSRRLRRGWAYSLMRDSAASTPSVVVGLVTKEKAPLRQRVLAVLVERDDLHRNVPGQRVLLELAEHRPAQHVRQEHVERDRGRLELLGKIERVGAARRQPAP